MTRPTPPRSIEIDIVSDVMCPWCIVGYRQLEHALARANMGAHIRWHPFELNPAMPPEGQNLAEHIAEKYGASPEQSAANRAHLAEVGTALGIDFRFSEDSRIVNTFDAHRLLGWAEQENLAHPLKLALFDAHFTAGRDVSDQSVLADVAQSVGLDRDAASAMLSAGDLAEETRTRQQFWTSRGISGVPSIVFDGRYLVTGAQGVENYTKVLLKALSDKDAA